MTITEKAMLAGLTISTWSARKLDRDVTDQTNREHAAVADAGRYNKMLMPAGALDDVNRAASKARQAHYARTLPWANDGNRILSSAAFAAWSKDMRDIAAEFEAAADIFADNYERFRERRRVELNGMFRETDYPTRGEIRGRFGMSNQIWPLPSADDFRVQVSAAESDRIRAEIQQGFDDAIGMAVRDVFQRVADVVGKMSERLRAFKPAAGGNKAEGIFRDSLVENVRELVGLLPSLNITGNATLAKIAARMDSDLLRYDAAGLRDDPGARAATAEAAADILAQVSDFLA